MEKNENVDEKALTKQENNKLIICGVLLAVGLFFAGIICSIVSLCMSLQVKKESGAKTAVIVLSIIEIIMSVISIIYVWKKNGII